ncbi:hypothetical protein CCACVL1_06066 [Corchorus capsularis]|uniref:Uncharacterized protein n=1 Tax=Corchorus capsularis TaxID=210143 RepID=A0A1R3JHQ6_COCAP|nr:hypothetical protein CCACVL1_06066 [Corchorus capsularis]
MAQQLIQEFISNHKEPAASIYSKVDAVLSATKTIVEAKIVDSSASSKGWL